MGSLFSRRSDSQKNAVGCNHPTCSVCYSVISTWQRVTHQLTTLPCKHVYHTKCVDPWLKRRSECPLCRRPAQRQLGIVHHCGRGLVVAGEAIYAACRYTLYFCWRYVTPANLLVTLVVVVAGLLGAPVMEILLICNGGNFGNVCLQLLSLLGMGVGVLTSKGGKALCQ